jgi:hypothetical protein
MVFSITLTGCGVTELTDAECYAVARYMADKLLQYDRSYGTDELVYIDPTKPTPEPEASAEPESSTAPSAEPVSPDDANSGNNGMSPEGGENAGEPATTDWSEFFTTDEWEITYSSYEACQSYPKKSTAYVVDAQSGKRLVVFKFNIVNKTDHKIKIDLTNSGLSYQLVVGEDVYKPLVTILDNGGLMFLNVSMKAHGKGKAVLIFEVPEGADLSKMRLDVNKS